VTVLQSGTTKKYEEGWESAFGGKKRPAKKGKAQGGNISGGKAKAASRKKAAGKKESKPAVRKKK
jgi:hypothetical protein